MAKTREISIHRIAQTKVNNDKVREWLRTIGAENFEMPIGITDPAMLVAMAGKRCYMSFEAGLNPNVTRIRKDYVEYFDNILASGHGSVLEHAVFTYAIEGVTRVFTAEMNRHRAGWAISEGSLRFIRFDKDIPFWMPESIREVPGEEVDLALRKKFTRELFMEAFEQDQEIYARFMKIWDMDEGHHNFAYKKKVTSIGRRMVGMGVSTGGVWTGNVRALRHVLAMRCAPVAEEEIAFVFSQVAKDIMAAEPMMFGDFNNDEGYFKPKYHKV